MKLQEILEYLDEAKILNYDFDMLRNKLHFSLEIIEKKLSIRREVEISGVSTFLFLNEDSKDRKRISEYEEGDYLEFTDINLLQNRVDIVFKTDKKWLQRFSGEGNIAIDIWNKLLVLEAKSIILDGNEYLL
jgi:hypothetical protein